MPDIKEISFENLTETPIKNISFDNLATPIQQPRIEELSFNDLSQPADPNDVNVLAGEFINATQKSERPGLIGRGFKQFVNKFFSEPARTILTEGGAGDIDTTLRLAESGTLPKPAEKPRKFSLRELGEAIRQSNKLSLEARKETRKAAEEMVPAFEIPAAKTTQEKAVDITAGVTAFIGRLFATRKFLGIQRGNFAGSIVTWETENIATGGSPGTGAAMRLALGGIDKIPATTMIGKTAKLGAESSLFGGLAAAAGGNFEEVAIAALIPLGFRAWNTSLRGIAKGRAKRAIKNLRTEGKRYGINLDKVPDEALDIIVNAGKQAKFWNKELTKGKISDQVYEQRLSEISDRLKPILKAIARQQPIVTPKAEPSKPTEPPTERLPAEIRGVKPAEGIKVPPKPIQAKPEALARPAAEGPGETTADKQLDIWQEEGHWFVGTTDRKDYLHDGPTGLKKFNTKAAAQKAGKKWLKKLINESMAKPVAKEVTWKKVALPATKIIDKDGEPLVVFHGTDETFTTFRNNPEGGPIGFFAESLEYAKVYGRNIKAVYLDIQNPIDFTEMTEEALGREHFAPKEIVAGLQAAGVDTSFINPLEYEEFRADEEHEIWEYFDLEEGLGANVYFGVKDFYGELKKQGFDGLILGRENWYDGKVYVPFSPKQIISAESSFEPSAGQAVPGVSQARPVAEEKVLYRGERRGKGPLVPNIRTPEDITEMAKGVFNKKIAEIKAIIAEPQISDMDRRNAKLTLKDFERKNEQLKEKARIIKTSGLIWLTGDVGVARKYTGETGIVQEYNLVKGRELDWTSKKELFLDDFYDILKTIGITDRNTIENIMSNTSLDDAEGKAASLAELFRNKNVDIVVPAIRKAGYDYVHINDRGDDNYIILNAKVTQARPAAEGKAKPAAEKEVITVEKPIEVKTKIPKAPKEPVTETPTIPLAGKEAQVFREEVKTQEKITAAEAGEVGIEPAGASFTDHIDTFHSYQLPAKSRIPRITKQMKKVNGLRLSGKITPFVANKRVHKLRKLLIQAAIKEKVALRVNKKGKVKIALRESGVFVPEDFATYGKFKDIKPLFGGGQDIKRAIQQMDGSLTLKEKEPIKGQAGPLERYVKWRTNKMRIQKLKWIDEKTIEARGILSAQGGKKDTQITLALEQIGKANRNIPIKDVLSKETLASMSEDSVKATQELRQLYDDMHLEQNAARAMLGRDPIPYLENYSPYILADVTIWSETFMKDKTAKAIEKADLPDYIKPNAPFNPRAMARESGIPYKKRVLSAKELVQSYIRTAANDIFNTSIIQNNKAFIEQLRAQGYGKSADYLSEWNAVAYAGIKPALERAVKLPKWAEKGMKYFNAVRDIAVFPLNFAWSLGTQVKSIARTVGKYGTPNTVRGFYSWMKPETRRRAAQDYYSYIIKSRKRGRVTSQDASDLLDVNVKLKRNAKEVVEDWSTVFITELEKILTGTSIEAAYLHGKKRGLKGEALKEYASDGGAKTQEMYNLEDKPMMLNSLHAKTFTPYQTFAVGFVNNLREFMGKTGTPPDTKLYAIWSLMRYLAAMTAMNMITNRIRGKEWSWWDMAPLPFREFWLSPIVAAVTRKWLPSSSGLTSPVGTAVQIGKGFNDVLETGSWRKLRNETIKYGPGMLGIPGGVQWSRLVDAIIVYSSGGLMDRRGRIMFEMKDPKDLARAIFTGVWTTKGGREKLKPKKKEQKPEKFQFE